MENRIAWHEILQAGSTRINYTALYLFQRFAAAARQESEILFPRWGKRLGEYWCNISLYLQNETVQKD